jgi:hypothetical protein
MHVHGAGMHSCLPHTPAWSPELAVLFFRDVFIQEHIEEFITHQ